MKIHNTSLTFSTFLLRTCFASFPVNGVLRIKTFSLQFLGFLLRFVWLFWLFFLLIDHICHKNVFPPFSCPPQFLQYINPSEITFCYPKLLYYISLYINASNFVIFFTYRLANIKRKIRNIFLKYLLFKRKIPYFYYKKLSYHLHLSTNSSLYEYNNILKMVANHAEPPKGVCI